MDNQKIAQQRAEFDACSELAKQMRRLELTAVVDDDYPAVRHDYESALKAFLFAVEVNRGPRKKRAKK